MAFHGVSWGFQTNTPHSPFILPPFILLLYEQYKLWKCHHVNTDPSSWAAYGVGLKRLDYWPRGFESRWGHGCSCLVFIVCCVGRRLWDELITSSEESYRVCVCVCVKETSTRRPGSELGCCATYNNFHLVPSTLWAVNILVSNSPTPRSSHSKERPDKHLRTAERVRNASATTPFRKFCGSSSLMMSGLCVGFYTEADGYLTKHPKYLSLLIRLLRIRNIE